MNYFKNIFVGLGVISIFALHPSLNKGNSPITYLQYLVYGNSLTVSSNKAVDIDALQIKWVCQNKNAACVDVVVFENGKQINDVPYEKGNQKLEIYYYKNKIGEVEQYKTVSKQANQYKIDLLAKNKTIFFKGEIIGPSPYNGPSITAPSLVSL